LRLGKKGIPLHGFRAMLPRPYGAWVKASEPAVEGWKAKMARAASDGDALIAAAKDLVAKTPSGRATSVLRLPSIAADAPPAGSVDVSGSCRMAGRAR
jgi:hypothetical protein